MLRVLANLIGNAIRFTPDGGRITVRVQAEERLARFSVADTGMGIAPRDLHFVFEQHWKGGGSGAGLGLFIARTIVQAHGGEIGVQSTLHQGTVFWFTIPRSFAAMDAAPFRRYRSVVPAVNDPQGSFA